jgi:hypothetical protein
MHLLKLILRYIVAIPCTLIILEWIILDWLFLKPADRNAHLVLIDLWKGDLGK